MTTFTFIPNSAFKNEEPRVLISVFGDGYQQRVGDGININKQIWDLNFVGLTDAQADSIESFLLAANGISNFDWTTPKGELIKVICKSMPRTYVEPDVNEMNLTFEQVFE